MGIWLDKRRQRWRYDFIENGMRYAGIAVDPITNRPASSKTEAKAIVSALRLRATQSTEGKIKIRPGAYTLGMAMDEVAERMQDKEEWQKYKKYIREFLNFYGPETPIAQITKTRIQDYIDWALKQKVNVYVGGPRKQQSEDRQVRTGKRTRSPTTVKRHLNALHAAFEMAHSLIDPLTQQPYLPYLPDFPSVKSVKRMARPPNDELLADMMKEAPAHLRDAMALSILMGFRKGEVFKLRVNQFDAGARGIWLDGEQTKGKRDEFVPANAAAIKILTRLTDNAKKAGQDRLILYQPATLKDGTVPPPRPVNDARAAWRTLRKKFNIEKTHRFHDLRAAFITALAHHAPARVVQELARHKSMTTTQGYIRVADEAQRSAVEAIGIKRSLLKSIPD